MHSLIIAVYPYGNNSNRLFQDLLIRAFCVENGISFINITFHPLAVHYRRRWRFGLGVLEWVFQRLEKAGFLSVVDLSSLKSKDECGNLLKSRRVVFVKGWTFSFVELVAKHREELLRRYVVPFSQYRRNQTYAQIKVWKSEHRVVGVHIRRGDYANFLGGKYFFPDETYRHFMEEMARELDNKERVSIRFVVFANDDHTFVDGENLIVSKNSWWIDHVLMSQCDYLIGPSSTFTTWASFLGDVPFFHIQSANDVLSLDKFCTQRTLNYKSILS